MSRISSPHIVHGLVIASAVSVTDLPGHEGLYVAAASGSLKAIDTQTGRTIALEQISEVRGFGLTQKQADLDSLKKAGEGISLSFIDLASKRRESRES